MEDVSSAPASGDPPAGPPAAAMLEGAVDGESHHAPPTEAPSADSEEVSNIRKENAALRKTIVDLQVKVKALEATTVAKQKKEAKMESFLLVIDAALPNKQAILRDGFAEEVHAQLTEFVTDEHVREEGEEAVSQQLVDLTKKVARLVRARAARACFPPRSVPRCAVLPRHDATPQCHATMPRHDATPRCHASTMPRRHATTPRHDAMHDATPRCIT